MTMLSALIAVGIAFALDSLTTWFALKRPGFEELDPFTVFFIRKIGLVPALIVPRYAFLGFLYWLTHAGLVWAPTLLVFAACYVGLAIWNLYQLRKGGAL
jgi:hypothetical protein